MGNCPLLGKGYGGVGGGGGRAGSGLGESRAEPPVLHWRDGSGETRSAGILAVG